MKASRRTKIIVDLCMTIFLALSFVRWEGDPTFHLVVGTACALFFVAHVVIHWKWLTSVTKSCVAGKMKPSLRGKYVVDLLLLVVWSLSIITGALAIGASAFAGVHGLTARLGLVLLVVHIVQHRGQIKSYCKRTGKQPARQRADG